MATSENLRGLVVEDTPEMAAQLKRILEKKFGLRVEVAPDCATAREKLKTEAFDIATLDFMLPDGRGLELLEEITARGDLPRVIMVTGHGDEESAVRSFRSEASGYVIKDSRLASRLAESVEKALVEIDLRRAQAELSRREAHFRSLTEKSSDIVTVFGADGTILYESPSVERFLGYKPDEMVGANVYDYVHPDDLPRLRRLVESALETPGALLVVEYRVRHKEGPWRFLESVGRNLLTDPMVGGVVVNSRDVTRRKLTELELDKYREQLEGLVQERTIELADANEQLREEIVERKQAQAMLQERAERLADFLTVASHELRHPISVVKGYTTMLQGYLERMEPEMLPEISDALNVSVNRLTAYVDELMEASLVEQGRYTFDIVDTDLRPLLEESIRDLKGLGVDKVVTLTVGEGAGTAMVDPRKFKRLIDMLLDNAIKFAQDGEHIDIEVSKDGKVTTVAVMDRGIGVPPEAREQIFERFYQVEEVQHHSSVGLGLGLYLARQIVTAHNGEIVYEPRDGGGSVFRFTMACG
jgi:PAS domain S-box-containing protein